MENFFNKCKNAYDRIVVTDDFKFAFGFMILVGILIVPITIFKVKLADNHRVQGTTSSYFKAQILASDTLTSTRKKTRVRVTIELPDGSTQTLMTVQPILYGGISDKVCIRSFEDAKTNRKWLAIALPHNCA
mgnify:CR=1 FL=1|jgi:hypothetical protein